MDAYFRASIELGHPVRWGCVGMRHPANWNTSQKTTTAQEQNNIKILRQQYVMDAYAKEYFKPKLPADVYKEMMAAAWFA